MATCKDCFHFDVCADKNGTTKFMGKELAVGNAEELCAHFKDMSRVFYPPCKVGDTVYTITIKHPCYACNYCTDLCHKSCRVVDKTKKVVKRARVCSIEFGAINKIHTEIEKTKITSAYKYTFWFEDFGETIFLTREAAEQDLKGR